MAKYTLERINYRNHVKISIIIAMYNIESYIAECINSCLSQTDVIPSDYEIIIVDDGSTDGSYNIALSCIKDHKNARIIRQRNKGLSEARNSGIKEAVGEYIWVVDGDDKISSTAVSVLLANIKITECDAYIFNFQSFGEDEAKKSSFERYGEIYSGEFIHNVLGRKLPTMAWLTVYRKQVLLENSINYYAGIIHEDEEYSVRAHHVCNSIMVLSECLYNYRLSRNGSIMTSHKRDNTKSFLSLIKIRESHKKFFDKKEPFSKFQFMTLAFQIILQRYEDNFNLSNIKLYKSINKDLYKDLYLGGGYKLKMLALLSSILPEPICKYLWKLFVIKYYQDKMH